MKTVKVICTAFVIGVFSLGAAHAQENRMDYNSNTYNSEVEVNSSSYNQKADVKEDRFRSKLGVKGGLNLSNLYIDDVDDSHMKEGFHVGLYSKMNIAGPFSLQPEFMYTRKGAEVTYNRADLQDVDYSLDYLELPLLLRLDIGGVNIHAGPYASYLMDVETKAEDRRGNQVIIEEDEGLFHSVDYGLSGGIGLEWRALDMGVRYNYGLRDVGYNGEDDPNNALVNGRNSVAQFYVGLGF